jgi:RND superfamily putative drug exporter
VCEHDRLDAVAQIELLEDVRDMRLHGRVADVELLADLGIREAAPRSGGARPARARSGARAARVAFRSIVIPIKAIVLNMLSVGAAYGVLVLIFQDGFGRGLLGFSDTSGITPVIPMLLFVILFGLSMDYHVFIVSRIREAFQGGADRDDAISVGIKSTAGVVTSAAVVMFAVFSVFATLSLLMFKQFGVGLAVAILIDATLVRGVLLPATMKLLGERNWYLPRWLEWLPRLEPEEPAAPEASPVPAH